MIDWHSMHVPGASRSSFSNLTSFVSGCIALLLAFGSGLSPAAAQGLGGGPVTVSKGGALQLGGLVQADLRLGQENVPDGFRARSARLRVGGEVKGLAYVVQTDFTSSDVLLDAYVQLPFADRARIQGGLFKTPYSAELLSPRPRIRFAERAPVVNALAPARQAGLQLVGNLTDPDSNTPVTVTAGVFNGTRGLATNDNDHFLYLGRLNGGLPLGPGRLDLGASVGYSVDDNVTIPNTTSSFSGTRVLFQADAEYEAGRWLLAGEVHAADLDSDQVTIPPASSRSPFGYYVTAGAEVAEGHQVLARLDSYDPDAPATRIQEEQLALGYNYDISTIFRVLVNYQAPTDDLTEGFVTGRLQVAF